MASARVFNIEPQHLPVASLSALAPESATELSKLLQDNHVKHNIYFNTMGFHNHIAHHLLSIYALGANPAQLQHAYAHNAQYQLPQVQEHTEAQSQLKDPKKFLAAMGDQNNYTDFLHFFTTEVSALGIDKALEEYLFKGDERAEAMFTRLFASFIHPYIHLGLAIEFDVPAMVAEALAWVSVHSDEYGDFIRAAEEQAKASNGPSPLPSVVDLFEELNKSGEVRSGVTSKDFFKGNYLYNKAEPITRSVAAKYRVPVDQLEERTNEAINAMAYVTLAAQMPPHMPKVDFFLVHLLNGSIFLPALSKRLAPAHAARMLECFVRTSLLAYSAMAAMDLHLDYVLSFTKDPKRIAMQYAGTDYKDWQSMCNTANNLDDDGHVSKAVRALMGAEKAAGKQTTYKELVKKEDMLGLAAMLLRSVEKEPDFVILKKPTNQWVRGCGFEDHWASFPKLDLN